MGTFHTGLGLGVSAMLVAGCTVTSTISSQPGPVAAIRSDKVASEIDVAKKRMPKFGQGEVPDSSRTELAGLVYTLPQTLVVIEGGPCIAQAQDAAKPKTAGTATATVAEGATQINITSSPTATSTATTAAKPDKDAPSEGGAKCNPSDDAAPFGINISTLTIADPAHTYQTAINLADFSADKHTLKVNTKGLLDSSDSTAESQVRQAVIDLAQLAGMLEGGASGSLDKYKWSFDESDPKLIAFDPKYHKLGSFRILCPINSAQITAEGKCYAQVPVLGKTVSATIKVTELEKTPGLRPGKAYLESTENCEWPSPPEGKKASDVSCTITRTRMTAAGKDGANDTVYSFYQTETRIVAKPPTLPAVARFGLVGGSVDCTVGECNSTGGGEGLKFRAPVTKLGQVDIFSSSPALFEIRARLAELKRTASIAGAKVGDSSELRTALNQLVDQAGQFDRELEMLEQQAEGDEPALKILKDTKSDLAALVNDVRPLITPSKPALPLDADAQLSLKKKLSDAIPNAYAVAGIVDSRIQMDRLSLVGKPAVSATVPLTVIDPSRTYSVTPVRRGLVTAKTTLDFDDGLLMTYDADLPGPGGVLVSLPGDAISAFFGGLKDIFTLRIEHINNEAALVNARTGLVEASGAYDEALETDSEDEDPEAE